MSGMVDELLSRSLRAHKSVERGVNSNAGGGRVEQVGLDADEGGSELCYYLWLPSDVGSNSRRASGDSNSSESPGVSPHLFRDMEASLVQEQARSSNSGGPK